MAGKPLPARQCLEFLHEPSLADAGLAAHENHEPKPGFPAGLDGSGELAQLRASADEAQPGCGRRPSTQASHLPCTERLVRSRNSNVPQLCTIREMRYRL